MNMTSHISHPNRQTGLCYMPINDGFLQAREKAVCGHGRGKKRQKKEIAIKLVTGRQEFMAVLQPVNSFLNPTDMHLNSPTATNTPQWSQTNKSEDQFIAQPNIQTLPSFFPPLSFFLHPPTSVMSPHPLSTPPSQGRTAGSSLGIRGSGAQVSPAATLIEPSLQSPSNEQVQVSAFSWFSKVTFLYLQ